MFIDKNGLWKFATTKDVVSFITQIHVGEKILLPQHMKSLHEMPKWILKQGMWEIKEVVHQVKDVSLEDADMILVTPTSNILETI